jgi:hypothetical protein
VPVDYTHAGSCHNVSEQTAETLQPGEITNVDSEWGETVAPARGRIAPGAVQNI